MRIRLLQFSHRLFDFFALPLSNIILAIFVFYFKVFFGRIGIGCGHALGHERREGCRGDLLYW